MQHKLRGGMLRLWTAASQHGQQHQSVAGQLQQTARLRTENESGNPVEVQCGGDNHPDEHAV